MRLDIPIINKSDYKVLRDRPKWQNDDWVLLTVMNHTWGI